MNGIYLVWKSLTHKKLTTLLSISLLAIGVITINTISLTKHWLTKTVTNQTKGIDLVVGAKGSPWQLLLSSIFHIDFPTGNISFSEAHNLSKNRLIKSAIPLSLGDSYKGYRIVGTNNQFLKFYTGDSSLTLTKNAVWIGHQVAKELGIGAGFKIISEHGLAEGGEAHDPVLVVGVLPPTGKVIDRLIISDLQTVWELHSHEKSPSSDSLILAFDTQVDINAYKNIEITSLLIQYRNPIGAIQLPRFINEQTNMQAASPVFEFLRLSELLSGVFLGVRLLGALLMILAMFSVFVSLVSTLRYRVYELAILRAFGTSRTKLFFNIMSEGLGLSIVGAVMGISISYMLFYFVLLFTGSQYQLNFIFTFDQMLLICVSVFAGPLAALFPAWKTVNSEISDLLSH